ncbi:hypothetical protein JOC34_003198 [Virgibacillus halotolerans]|uniref:M23 family metallopeptidase n=1 Tax=Virgibacillus halotolerans TaxID=1071053 RepID=UPI001EF8FD38|nr:M23 family metallopeptidase [Virgibacillus halotolerans]MBM7600784.1 hypothetical protein [Virgibacillus halotolerans]
MTFDIIQMVIIVIILPAVFIFTLWRLKANSKLDWMLQALLTAALISWLFFGGNWSWLGYYIRYIWVILLIPAIYFSWKNNNALPFRKKLQRRQKISTGINILILLVFAMYNVFVFSSLFTKDEAIELSSPLKDGTYYVAHGGSNTLMNYHHAYEPQQYAMDILKLNGFGTRARGLHPKQLDKYEIYGDTIYSPCNGEVLEAKNDLPDQIPPETNPEQPEGNHVTLACENIDAIILLAHMQENSVTVDKGDSVKEGQQIGLVGNSGNTSEPHLHIHAEKNGIGIPIQFDGKFLVRNNLVR